MNERIRIDRDMKNRLTQDAGSLYARRQSQKQLDLSCCARESCTSWSPWGHFPSSMDRLLTFWLAAGLTLPVHHWALSIPQHLKTAHKFKGPSMNSASQHPVKGLHHMAIKKNSSISLTLISSLAKSHRNKLLGTLQWRRCWVLTAFLKVVLVYFGFLLYFSLYLPLTGVKQNLTLPDGMISALSLEKWRHLAYSGIFKW